jgi:trimethylamine:corrinoid methyltransferase-like protein
MSLLKKRKHSASMLIWSMAGGELREKTRELRLDYNLCSKMFAAAIKWWEIKL